MVEEPNQEPIEEPKGDEPVATEEEVDKAAEENPIE